MYCTTKSKITVFEIQQQKITTTKTIAKINLKFVLCVKNNNKTKQQQINAKFAKFS